MRNLAHNAIKIENIRLEFLNKGFSEEAIDFVLFQNDNYNFEVLKEKIIDVEKNLKRDVSRLNSKIDIIEKNLDIMMDNIKNKFNPKIYNVSTRSVYASLDKSIYNLSAAISMRTKTICISIIVSTILGPILNVLFMKYLQGIK
ncbi:Bdr family repetitive protein [Borreliella bissettiae]|uniref:Bdr family repetitive protein n=1 Tax=Borrelia bissettiae TaxID=64897 RepID=UPI003AB4F473